MSTWQSLLLQGVVALVPAGGAYMLFTLKAQRRKLGADLSGVDTPFSITADAPFAAAFTNIQVVAGAADGPDAVKCAQ